VCSSDLKVTKDPPKGDPFGNPMFLFSFTGSWPKSALGLEGRIGWPGTSLGGIYSADSFHSFHQGLKSGGWRPRPAAVGRDAPQIGPKTGEVHTIPAVTEPKRASFSPGMVTALRPGLRGNR